MTRMNLAAKEALSRATRLQVCACLAGAALLCGSLACFTSSSTPGDGGSVDGGGLDATFGEDGGEGGVTTLAQCLSGVLSGPLPSGCSPFVQCLENDCAPQLTTCFGAAYATGIIAGECASFESCGTDHACTAAAGVTCESQTTSSCQQCVTGLVSCAAAACPGQFQACGDGLLSDLHDAGATPPVDGAPGSDATLVDASGSDATGADVAALDTGMADAGSEAAAGLDLSWAQWPIPNSPVDTQAGAPNPESYTVNGDGTVNDDVTGLVWQQTPTGTDGGSFPGFLPTDAPAYCAGLSLAGHSDWRLPTAIELVSIVDYGAPSPGSLVDSTAFPGTPSNWFWTATPEAGGTQTWAVHFGYGYTGFPSVVEAFPVRCVRGEIGPFASVPMGAPPGRYTTTGTGAAATVYDTKTLLTWQVLPRFDGGSFPQMDFPSAAAYCAGVTLNGQAARLPTVNELLSLFDFSNSGSVTPCIDPTYFPGTPAVAPDFWASTPAISPANSQWYVSFAGAGTNPQSVYSQSYVRCVR